MGSYAEGFLKAIEVVRDYSLTTFNENVNKTINFADIVSITRIESECRGIALTLKRLNEYYDKEIKNGIRD